MARGSGGDLSLDLQVDAFNACLRDMQRKLATSRTMEQVVDYEVGRIVNQAIRKTTRATIGSIKRSQEGRPPWRTYDLGAGRKKYFLENRYPNALWAKMQARLNQTLAMKFQARELARRVWVEILLKLNQRVEATGQAQIAKSGSFVASSAAGVQKLKQPNIYGVEIENSYGKNRWVGASQALFAAIAGRRRFFETNVAKGVFSDLEKVAKKYPGMTVTY